MVAVTVLVGAGVGGAVAIGPARLWGTPRRSSTLSNQPGHRVSFATVQVAIADLASTLAEAQPLDVMLALSAILRDPKLADEIRDHMAEGSDAATAVRSSFANFARRLEDLGGYFAQRAADLDDLAERVVQRLTASSPASSHPSSPSRFEGSQPSAYSLDGESPGGTESTLAPAPPGIVVARRLSPIDVSGFKPDQVLGFITVEGGTTSHTAVVARAQNLPAVLSVVGAEVIREGDMLLLDSTSGQVFVNPDQELLNTYRVANRVTTDLDEVPTTSAIPIYANIGSSTEGRAAKEYGADGVGLYRSELMFLGRTEPPTLEEQVFEYSRLLARFAGRRVIARLLDLDNDKPLPFLIPAKDGRYSGRGLSTLLLNRAVLETQLKALQLAHGYYPDADLWVMAPMVTHPAQVVEYVALARGIGLPKVGVMIEVPEVTEAAALAEILKVVDFISIGTNDLTRYTLGLNRELGMRLADTRNPAVMNQVKQVIAQSKAAGIAVGVCGEAAADPETARELAAYGVDSLSASPALIPALRQSLD